MTTPSRSSGRRLAPSATGRATRHLGASELRRAAGRLPLPGLDETDRGGSAHRRDLEIVAVTVIGMAAVLTGSLVWLAAALLLAAMVVGSLQLLAEVDGPDADRGVPVEALIVPSIAAIGCAGAIRLVPLGLAVVPALLLAGVLIDRALVIEERITAAPQGPTEDDRAASLATILLVALVAFVGVAAIIPGGIAGLEPAGAPVPPLALGNLVLLALTDALIAGLLGYRAAALRMTNARDALWAALTYAAAIAVGAAAIRAMGIPRLVGPALLMFLFYLWDTLHSAPPSRRRDPRWIWETAILAAAGAAVAFWNLRLDG